MKWPTINKELLPIKRHFLLINLGLGPIAPFASVYARQLGFSSTVVGTINTILPVAGIIARPLLGGIADKYKKHRVVFLTCLILTMLGYFSIQFIPEVPELADAKVSLVCGPETGFYSCDFRPESVDCRLECGVAELELEPLSQVGNCTYFRAPKAPSCETENEMTCEVKCDDPGTTRLLTKERKSSVDVTTLYQYWLLFFLLNLIAVALTAVVSFSDAICVDILGSRKSALYGAQRMWGSIGWGLMSIITGLVVDAISEGEKKNYIPCFYFMLVFFIADIVSCYFLKYNFTMKSPNIVKDLGKLLLNVRIDIFILVCIFAGMLQGVQMNFFLWYIEDLAEAQGPDMTKNVKTLEGLVTGLQCFLGEVPSFFMSGLIIRKIGHVHAITLVLFVQGCRFLLTSIIVNPWWSLALTVLQSSYGLFYASMVSYSSIVAPPGTEATVQGLVGMLFEGIGLGVGSLLTGLFFDTYGGATSFRIFGFAALVVCVIHGAVQFVLDRFSIGQVHKESLEVPTNNDDGRETGLSAEPLQVESGQ